MNKCYIINKVLRRHKRPSFSFVCNKKKNQTNKHKRTKKENRKKCRPPLHHSLFIRDSISPRSIRNTHSLSLFQKRLIPSWQKVRTEPEKIYYEAHMLLRVKFIFLIFGKSEISAREISYPFPKLLRSQFPSIPALSVQ